MMNAVLEKQKRLSELAGVHEKLYADSTSEERLQEMMRTSPCSSLSKNQLVRLFRDTKAIVFDTHVAMVSGHHSETYLGFEAVARHPQWLSLLSHDMGQWLLGLGRHHRIDGLLVPASEARRLAEGIASIIHARMPVRVVHAPFDPETGKIGTEISGDAIRKGENFVVINDVTARASCVNKLGTIVNEHGGQIAGMMVFARRDSGQFPFIDDLMSRYPFYYTANLTMPQWLIEECPKCRKGEDFFSWKEMPV